LKLIELSRQRVQRFGPVVPGDYLNRIVDAPAIFYFYDRPMPQALAAFDKFAEPLSG